MCAHFNYICFYLDLITISTTKKTKQNKFTRFPFHLKKLSNILLFKSRDSNQI